MKCHECGSTLPADALFCTECGVRLVDPSDSKRQVARNQELAGRGIRLLAVFVDSLLFAIPATLLASDYEDSLRLTTAAVISGVIALILLVIQVVMLTSSGQTVGKRLFSIRIVGSERGEIGGFVRLVILRTCVNGLFAMIPGYGLLDALLIFREDRRCLHDLLAKTRVVKV